MTIYLDKAFNKDDQCAICLEPLPSTGETVAAHSKPAPDASLDGRISDVGSHFFDMVCFKQLIASKPLPLNCPLCRVEVEGKDMEIIRNRVFPIPMADLIIEAAIDGDSHALRTLLDPPQEVSISTVRTALKFAALWGRIATVQVLVNVEGITREDIKAASQSTRSSGSRNREVRAVLFSYLDSDRFR